MYKFKHWILKDCLKGYLKKFIKSRGLSLISLENFKQDRYIKIEIYNRESFIAIIINTNKYFIEKSFINIIYWKRNY
jgi:hypothetical protein